jgi:hypothetical protein
MWNILVVGLPVMISIALIGSVIYANVRANTLQADVREIFIRMENMKTLQSDFQECSHPPPAGSSRSLFSAMELSPLLLQLRQDAKTLSKSMQFSFACWTIGGMINFAIWVPCFIIQLKIYKKQVDDEHGSFNHPKPSPNRVTPLTISLPLEIAGSPVVHLEPNIPAYQVQKRQQAWNRPRSNGNTNNSCRSHYYNHSTEPAINYYLT